MIQSLKLLGAPAFEAGAEIDELQPCTFIFGSNGAGKTTISRALIEPQRFPGTTVSLTLGSSPVIVKAYNRDYVNHTYRAAHSLKGVFRLVDKKESRIRDQIDALEGGAGTIASKISEIRGLCPTLGTQGLGDNTAMIPRRDSARATLLDAAWSAKRKLTGPIVEIFTGYNNSKEKFLGKVLEVAAASPTSTTILSELDERARSAFALNPVPILLASELSAPTFVERSGFKELGVPILGRSEVSVAELIDMLDNADWVREGLPYLSRSDGRCPFCQQGVTHDLSAELGEFFDAGYTRRLRAVDDFVDWHDTLVTTLKGQLASLESRTAELHLDEAIFGSARLELEALLSANSILLKQKQEHPGTGVTLKPIGTSVSALNDLVAAANLKVEQHNTSLRDQATARAALIDDYWVHFVRVVLGVQVATFEAATAGLDAGIRAVEEKLSVANQELEELSVELRSLKNSVSSTAETVEAINNLLRSVGFTNFSLVQSQEVADGYAVVRADGSAVLETLSEGERTFITFLYFYQQLKGLAELGEPESVVAVIDDPISSLDSDVLFVVSSLVRGLLRDAQQGSGRVRQVILLTHNTYFHRQVAYLQSRDSRIGRTFISLRKRTGEATQIIKHGAHNPVKTTYIALWEEVRRAHSGDGSVVSLQNVMRRILENYFRVVGKWDVEIVNKFDGDERSIAQSLISWLHDGSHSILEELDYSPTAATIQQYIEVFERIFAATGHEAHYNMMLGAQASAGEAALLGELGLAS